MVKIMDELNREKLFVDWLEAPIHPTIKASTLDSYITALKKSFSLFDNTKMELDIFKYKNLADFQYFFKQIRQNEKYDKVNKTNNGSYQALLKKYEKYLSEMADKNYISKDDFIEWATLQKKSYNPSWIKIYTENLKTFAFGLQENDDLKINLFKIDNADAFNIASAKIKADKNFDYLNTQSTQKSFSAALGRYFEFLSSEIYLSQFFVAQLIDENLIDKTVKTEIERTVLSRIGQSDFRRKLIQRDRACLLCQIPYKELLRASHIKPWSVSNNQERLDLANGFLLCVNHDALFDKGFISFDENGNIEISQEIDLDFYSELTLNSSMNVEIKSDQEKYLFYHRHEIFKH